MSMCVIKRAFPFALTLLFSLGMVAVFNGMKSLWPGSATSNWRSHSYYGRKQGCSRRWRMRTEESQWKTFDNTKWTTFLSNPQPRYTEEARANRIEGDVRLRVTFGSDGKVTDVETLNGLPYGLTEEAIKAVNAIRFIPASRDGIPIDETRVMTYSFDLNWTE